MNFQCAETAALLSDPGRTAMMMALLGDIALPAGQLAIIANIAPQTASSHLSKLVSGRLLVVEQQGRHRYYRLASADVGNALEALLAISARQCDSFAAANAAGNNAPIGTLAFARTCYSHLAGRVAVDIADALLRRKYLELREPRMYAITESGRAWFEHFGIVIRDSRLKQPRFARRCLDWTERRYHIAGELGTAMLSRFRELKWIAPVRGSRAVRVTVQGQEKLSHILGLRLTNGRAS